MKKTQDLSNKDLGIGEAFILGHYLDNNESLSHLNILKNKIEGEGLRAIEAVLTRSQTLKSICGAKGSQLDLSGQKLRAGDAKIVAVELTHNSAITSLDISNNKIIAKSDKDSTFSGSRCVKTIVRHFIS